MTGQAVATVNDDDKWAVSHTDKIAPFIPDGFASVYKFSQLIAASGMAPKDMKSPDQVAVAIFHGLEIGLTPMAALQSIAVINGRPSIWGDGALAIVRASGEVEEFEELYEGGELYLKQPEFNELGVLVKAGTPNPAYKAVCRLKRKGRPAKDYEFSVLDAIEAGLYNKEGPWRQYRKRMLKMRARSFALRDEFTDIMRGMVLAEEAQDYDILPGEGGGSTREEPPAASEQEIAVPAGKKAARKKAEPNKYTDVDTKVTDIDPKTGDEVEEGKASEDAGESEDPPGAAEQAKPAAEPEKAKPKPKPAEQKKADPVDENAVFMKQLLDDVGADKPLKEYLIYCNDILSPIETEEAMKPVWLDRKAFEGVVASQRVIIEQLRDWHKARINAIAKGEEPPAATGKDAPKGAVFDFQGFVAAVDKALGTEKKPDDVNKVYAQMTAAPIKEGIISEAQVKDVLLPLLATHLDRTDYGN